MKLRALLLALVIGAGLVAPAEAAKSKVPKHKHSTTSVPKARKAKKLKPQKVKKTKRTKTNRSAHYKARKAKRQV